MTMHDGGWYPGRTNKNYWNNYNLINWDLKKPGVARKGKARGSSSTFKLEVDETYKAVSTPMHQRTDKTFRHLD